MMRCRGMAPQGEDTECKRDERSCYLPERRVRHCSRRYALRWSALTQRLYPARLPRKGMAAAAAVAVAAVAAIAQEAPAVAAPAPTGQAAAEEAPVHLGEGTTHQRSKATDPPSRSGMPMERWSGYPGGVMKCATRATARSSIGARRPRIGRGFVPSVESSLLGRVPQRQSGFSPVGHVEFGKYTRHVMLDRLFVEIKDDCDPLIAEP